MGQRNYADQENLHLAAHGAPPAHRPSNFSSVPLTAPQEDPKSRCVWIRTWTALAPCGGVPCSRRLEAGSLLPAPSPPRGQNGGGGRRQETTLGWSCCSLAPLSGRQTRPLCDPLDIQSTPGPTPSRGLFLWLCFWGHFLCTRSSHAAHS